MPKTLCCEHCGAGFRVPPSRIQRFCSVECYNAGTGRVRVGRECEQCGLLFTAKPHRADQRFCSHVCMYAYRSAHGFDDGAQVSGPENSRWKPRVALFCNWCREPYTVPRYRHKRSRFCSQQCQGSFLARRLQKSVSGAERRFVAFLRSHGLHVETQVQFGHFTLDAWFPGTRIVVEFDGDYWHSIPRVIAKDARKDAALFCAGYSVVRVLQSEFDADPDAVLRRIENMLSREVAA